MKHSLTICLFAAFLANTTVSMSAPAADSPIKLPLWPGKAPVGDGTCETVASELRVYLPPPDKATGAAVLMASPVGAPSASAAEDGFLPSGLERDFQNVPMADKPWAYWWWLKGNVTKESITADADIYFLAGKGLAECVFRVHGKEPELWDPVTGNRRDALLLDRPGTARIRPRSERGILTNVGRAAKLVPEGTRLPIARPPPPAITKRFGPGQSCGTRRSRPGGTPSCTEVSHGLAGAQGAGVDSERLHGGGDLQHRRSADGLGWRLVE